MVRGAFALRFNQQVQVIEIVAVPLGERREQLEPVGLGVDRNGDAAAVLGGRFIAEALASESVLGHLWRRAGRVELECLAVGACQRVGERVERQCASQPHRHHQLRTADEIHR